MTTTHEALDLSADLYALLRLVDPASFRDEVDREARTRLARITDRARALLDDDTKTEGALRTRVRAVLAAVERARATAPAATRAYWAAFQREVHPAYEALTAALRTGHEVAPVLRPTNYARSVFHVVSALVAFTTILVAPTRGWLVAAAGLFFAFAWSMETTRRVVPGWNDRLMKLFGPVAHAHEWHRVNSATWYATALMVLSLAARPAVSAVAVLVLGLADPAAGLVGRRYGRVKLRANRSLEGTLAFALTAFLAALSALSVLWPVPWGARVVLALVAAVMGSLAELFSTRLDDNFTIPLAVAAGLGLASRLLGV